MTDTSPGTRAERIDTAAAMLIEARTTGRLLAGLPAVAMPVDVDEAMAVDDRVAELTGWDVLGWKIGCTSEHAQVLLGSPEPLAGRVYAISETGARIGPDELGTNRVNDPMIEGEFAFTIGTDLNPGPQSGVAKSRAEVVAAIRSVHPAIEVVGGRFTNFLEVPLFCLVADAGTNTHLVLGPAAEGIDPEQLAAAVGRMTVDGTEVGRGTGADVLGHPITALLWLVTHLERRGISLRAGQVVSTGTLTQVVGLPAGATAVASFDDVGQVSVSWNR